PTPVDTPATGTATVVFTVSEAGEISYQTDLDVSNLQGDLLPVNIGNGTLSPIHLHNAPAGENGPVVGDVASDAGDGLVIVDETDVVIEVENLVGSGGDDVVVAAEFGGVDGRIDAGDGIDTVDFSGFTSGISVDLDLNTPQPGPASQDGALVSQVGPGGVVIQEFDDFENVIGSNFDDVIFGNNEINILEGGAGNDLIHSFGGADVLDGGSGIDTALFSAAPVGVTVDLDENGDAVSSFGDTLIDFENINGSVAGDDSISGNSGVNVLNGQGGNDTLAGEGGNDILIGGAGSDVFVFAPGTDDDTVTDFEDGIDFLDVTGFGPDFDVAGAVAGAVQDGDDTVVTLTDTDSVRLAGFDVANLNDDDFIA
ncbi:MAG: CHRD domain-containing protein, partial [Pseudomonadota bacterium]